MCVRACAYVCVCDPGRGQLSPVYTANCHRNPMKSCASHPVPISEWMMIIMSVCVRAVI